MKKSKTQTKFDVFSDAYLGSVRTMFDPKTRDIYFHAVDVALCLGYRSAASAVSIHTRKEDRIVISRKDLCEEDKKLFWSSTRGRGQVTFIKEAAMYKLIMVSQTEVAEKFKVWVGDVLVAIRQNGGYIYGQENLTLDEREKLLVEIADLRKKVEMLTKAEADVKSLQARHRKLMKEKSVVVEKNRVLKKNFHYMKEDSDYWYKMYERLMSKYDDLEFKYSSLVKPNQPFKNKKTPVFPRDEYAILPNGLIVKKLIGKILKIDKMSKKYL